MKALTVHQPHAALIVAGIKRFETRDWSTDYRGPLAIHAGRAEPDGPLVHLEQHLARLGGRYLDRGAVVGTVWLTDVLLVEQNEPLGDGMRMVTVRTARGRLHSEALPDSATSLGDWSPGRYLWRCDRPRPVLPAVPCRGMQGLWMLPADVEQLVLQRSAA